MTFLDLETIRKRRAAITPGDWWIDGIVDTATSVDVYVGTDTTIARDIKSLADAEFFANAADDIDALIGFVDVMNELYDELVKVLKNMKGVTL